MLPPETGSSDSWRPSTPDTIDVEPESLAHFADLLEGDRNHFTISRADGFDALFQEYPPFAGGEEGLAEGHAFQNAYFHISYAMQCLLTDVQNGLMCLDQAAKHIAAGYAEADSFSAATVDAVNRAFEDVVQPLGPATVPDPTGTPQMATEQDVAAGDDARSGEDVVIREDAPGEVVYDGDQNRVQERDEGSDWR